MRTLITTRGRSPAAAPRFGVLPLRQVRPLSLPRAKMGPAPTLEHEDARRRLNEILSAFMQIQQERLR
jgi:hypothetical protein